MSKDPKAFLMELKTRPNYVLKGVGLPKYYLGGDYSRFESTMSPNKKYVFYLSAKTYVGNVYSKIEST